MSRCTECGVPREVLESLDGFPYLRQGTQIQATRGDGEHRVLRNSVMVRVQTCVGVVERVGSGCYSPRVMTTDSSVKALLIAVTDDAPAAVYAINRLKPELLCFYVAEPGKIVVEANVQPHIAQMPRLWDWVVTPDAHRFMPSYQALSRALPEMLRTWEV
ncbi:MAG: hypothetical protein ACE5NA_13385, partial [Nitrospiraceae bacterium]